MNLTTISMDRTEARKRFLEYRRSVKERHTQEDEQIMRGYRALSKGQQVIDLAATIRQGGTTELRRHVLPRLAVMRADQQWCHVHVTPTGAVTFHSERYPSWNQTRNRVGLPVGTVADELTGQQCSHWDHRALVPLVPPALRPAHKLSNYYVLWEAEWHRSAPVDPALLKHIGGDLYAVLATWDLTELERGVLAGRFG